MQLPHFFRIFLVLIGLAVGIAVASAAAAEERPLDIAGEGADAEKNSEKLFPRFNGAGGVYRIEQAPALDPAHPHKLLLDITADGPKDQVHPGLEHAARALNLYALANLPRDKTAVAVVVHSKATPLVLSDAAYRRAFDIPNPNSDLLSRLNEAGVNIRICGQALRHHDFHESDVSSSVNVDLSAMTALVELQNRGYALIPD